LNYSKEIPYVLKLLPKNFLKTTNIIRIRSLIMVEREPQKELIGHKRRPLKKVGTEAREDLRNLEINIELYAKVNKPGYMNQMLELRLLDNPAVNEGSEKP
jgi:GTP-binding protein Era